MLNNSLKNYDMITNVEVYGLNESIKASKYPMSVDTEKCAKPENIKYWLEQGNFLNDFIKYQEEYGKEKCNEKGTCYFCRSKENVEKNNKIGKYICAKHNHQIERYGECFEITPKYIVEKDYIECVVVGDKRKETSIKINAIDLPLIFYSDGVSISNGYVNLYNKTDKSSIGLHRKIFNLDENSDFIVDHIDRNPNNNTRDNLRICTSQENNRNRKVSKNNKSGILGVCWSKEKNKWRSHISINGKQKFLGYYNNIEDAIVARLIAEKECFKDFAPQKHLFKQYGIEEDIKKNIEIDYNKQFYDIFKMYKVTKNLGNTAIGTGHSNFEKGIVVQFDLTMTPKMSVELERYHFIDFVSSQSTMHKITKFDLDKSYIEYVDKRCIDVIKELITEYNNYPDGSEKYDTDYIKNLYLRILYSNPCGVLLTARMTTNYQQLRTIYQQRRTHRLPEWQEFCDWVETLPHFKELCLDKQD